MTLAKRLRELPETASSLLAAVTGYGQEEDKQKSLAGVSGILCKRFFV
ncbi:hypothetical protein ACO0LF_31045 [Undibacterium sp. Di27W]